MKRHISCFTTTVQFALALLHVLAPAAWAANRYGVIGLTNETEVTITYQVQVGDGPWQSKTIAPGARVWFSHEYARANENHSPVFRIRFDSDLRRGRDFAITYKLEHRAAIGQGYEYGKKYAFKYDGGNRSYIDLKSID